MDSFISLILAQSNQSLPAHTESVFPPTNPSEIKGWTDVLIAYNSTVSQILWVFFWLVFINLFKPKLLELFSAIIKRINEGSDITAKTPIVEVGITGSHLPSVLHAPNVNVTTTEGITGKEIKNPTLEELVLNYQDHTIHLSERLYLVHSSEVLKRPDPQKPGSGNYAVRVWLEGYGLEDLQDCFRVTYRLHDSFNQRIISTEACNQQFELWLTIWGEFTVIAYLERKNGKSPIWLTRYLDLPGRPQDPI